MPAPRSTGDRDDRPDPRRPRRAHHVRPQARRLGVSARAGSRAPRRRAGGMRVGKLSGAVGTYAHHDARGRAASPARALGLEPAPSSTQILQRDRHAALLSSLAGRVVARAVRARDRHLARTEVREVEEPFARGSEGLVGDAAQAESRSSRSGSAGSRGRPWPRARRRSRTSRSGTSATSRTRPERVVLPDAFLAVDYMPTASVARRGPRRARSGCARTSRRRAACSSASVCCSPSSSGLERDEAYGSCSATRCGLGRGPRLP